MGAVLKLARQWGKPLVRDGRERFQMYPRGYGPGESAGRWLYAFGYTDGRTKIGVTGAPRQRMFEHWRASNGAITWSHLSARLAYDAGRPAETATLNLAAGLSSRIERTEVFHGLSRDDAIRCIREAVAGQQS